jgi:hypothetical protein
VRALQQFANERCVDDRKDLRVDSDHVENLYHYFEGRMPKVINESKLKIDQMTWMAQYYSERFVRRVKYKKLTGKDAKYQDMIDKYVGKVEALYGAPDKPLPPRISADDDAVSAAVIAAIEPCGEDPDGFGPIT